MRSCKGRHDVKNVKDQLSIVIKNQLDFQQKIETQMNTLQTMMQTVCQLVNSEIISNRKSDGELKWYYSISPEVSSLSLSFFL